MTVLTIIALTLLIALVVLVVWFFSLAHTFYQFYAQKLGENLRAEAEMALVDLRESLERMYQRALASQRGSISGEIKEMYCPFAPDYPYDLRDVVAVFDTFDFLVLNGRNSERGIQELVFQEMKTGWGVLGDAQKQLRDCVKAGRVKFEQWRLGRETNKWYLVKSRG